VTRFLLPAITLLNLMAIGNAVKTQSGQTTSVASPEPTTQVDAVSARINNSTLSRLVTVVIAVLPALAQSPEAEQAAKLHRAEQIADSVMTQVHETFDFEPILQKMIAPEFVKLLRTEEEKAVSDRDMLRVGAATLTVLYLSQVLQASLKNDGANCESDVGFPPEVKSAIERFDDAGQAYQRSVQAAGQIENLLGLARNARAEIIKHLRPGVFTSAPYKTFLERYRPKSKVSSLPNPLDKEPVYEVCSEAICFSMVERDGAMKIVAIVPAWMD
jgi:hypothetical protein